MISLNKTLAAFNYAEAARVTWMRSDGVEQWGLVKRFAPSNQAIRAEVAKQQRVARSKIGKDNTFLTGDYETEVLLFCEISLTAWYVLDDDDKEVPVEAAPDVFMHGSDPGRELFFKLLQFAMDETNYSVTAEDLAKTEDEDLKN